MTMLAYALAAHVLSTKGLRFVFMFLFLKKKRQICCPRMMNKIYCLIEPLKWTLYGVVILFLLIILYRSISNY